ncbi:MAG: ABC transporter ATP-binding protein [Pseudarcicella sp.]|nr:ABC transporter ATP-binding protein [Pseudarcicella sp.]MBP6409492.1 ABC transporter ATP-binding protein [Pseudarcicella sp.]
MLRTIQLRKNYENIEVLKGIDLHIQKGEIVSIVGASGAGKSTLLQLLGTLDKPDSGEIFINNQNINKLKKNEIASFRNQQLGFIFQFHNLLGEFTALENVLMPAYIAGNKNDSTKRAIELLETLGLKDKINSLPSQMSGGEQQRAAVARALINNPAVIFADEPSGNLDSKNANELHQLFFDLREQFNQTFVIVTHNTDLAKMADRKLIMQDGLLIN